MFLIKKHKYKIYELLLNIKIRAAIKSNMTAQYLLIPVRKFPLSYHLFKNVLEHFMYYRAYEL